MKSLFVKFCKGLEQRLFTLHNTSLCHFDGRKTPVYDRRCRLYPPESSRSVVGTSTRNDPDRMVSVGQLSRGKLSMVATTKRNYNTVRETKFCFFYTGYLDRSEKYHLYYGNLFIYFPDV